MRWSPVRRAVVGRVDRDGAVLARVVAPHAAHEDALAPAVGQRQLEASGRRAAPYRLASGSLA